VDSHAVLDGEKTWISNGGIADFYVVFARTGEAPGSRGLSAFARNHLYLFAFAKTAALAPGASQLLTVSAPVAALGSWEAARQAYVVEPGTYSFVVGPDSETVSGASFNVTI
jgi:hypothetical protein